MRIIICDDQAIVREGLAMLSKLDREIEIVGLAENGLEAVELVENAAADAVTDVVLMDLKMPGMNGIEATRRICARYPQTKVLVLTTYDDDEWVFDAIRAGASGYLLKDTPYAEVVAAIKGTVAGGAYTDPAVTKKLLHAVANQQLQHATLITNKLTERETDVLRFLARGLNNATIAEELHLSEGTVRNHISAILAKLEVSDRTQAAVIAVKHGIR
ncbi:MAG: response regulator transcription factor [Chloroflexi bacterium AL-W]|nr:response regulator transcription factor [Chloroflexi bacterium AL-N1]NOK68812.1 response regulator transcription factor [Chloroflexi bacterium AL-N10]NOK76298.1 response regulator transcription factor [Chloroflexi bacterium AL-N5]NOK84065.1 response regulator transcription factor [Chloroflexi bacterium AL-W]NOK91436.1 response regulator transcription factor [Chloroflexi bacterium AL-N15]